MERVFLAVVGLVFAAFGVVMMVDPLPLLAGGGVEVAGRHGAFEMRGVYGGVSLGIGAACLIALIRPGLRAGAHLLLLAYCGGYIIGRVAGFALDGPPEPNFYVFIAWEAGVALLAALFLGRRPAAER